MEDWFAITTANHQEISNEANKILEDISSEFIEITELIITEINPFNQFETEATQDLIANIYKVLFDAISMNIIFGGDYNHKYLLKSLVEKQKIIRIGKTIELDENKLKVNIRLRILLKILFRYPTKIMQTWKKVRQLQKTQEIKLEAEVYFLQRLNKILESKENDILSLFDQITSSI